MTINFKDPFVRAMVGLTVFIIVILLVTGCDMGTSNSNPAPITTTKSYNPLADFTEQDVFASGHNYEVHCFKGLTLIKMDTSWFYEVDVYGKPIPCK